MTLHCITDSWCCSGRALGLFLPATLWVSWKVLYGNRWRLASGEALDFVSWEGVGTRDGFVLVSDFLMLLGSSIPELICRVSPLATAGWVKMCLPLLVQRNSLYLLSFLMLSYVARISR